VDLEQGYNQGHVFYERFDNSSVLFDGGWYTNDVVDFIYCSEDRRDPLPNPDPFANEVNVPWEDQYIRYFITNNIIEPDGSELYSDHFDSDICNGAAGNPMSGVSYILRVRVTDFAGNPVEREFEFCVDNCPDIKR